MKLTNPKSLSFFSAAVIVILFTALFIPLSFYYYEFKWVPLILIDAVLFAAIYFIFYYALEYFIYDKIRVIYKSIHRLKTPKEEEQKKSKNIDIIQDVREEVLTWGKNRKDEIARLKGLETYRREFLGNISHELKTPIFNIQGYVLTLLDGGLEDPNINKVYLKRTEKSINRMIAIVEDLETISNLETNQLKLKMGKFDIVALARDVMEFLDMAAKKNNTELYLRKNYDKPIMVEADQKRIRQVLINLIENSIKYSKEKGRTKISFFDMDENVLVEVTDNGVGIAQDDLPRIFERFYRTDKARARSQGGTGLGLAIVKHIIEVHGQTINVRSTVGIGSTFAFTLKKT
jgi:two-component system phosphate regulon sensor histidine kinase PhoR